MNHYIFQAFKITKPATLLDSSSSTVAKSCLTPLTKWIVAGQAPLSMEFSRQEYWSGLPFPSPGDLPNPGIELRSPTLQADGLSSEPPGKPLPANAEELRDGFDPWVRSKAWKSIPGFLPGESPRTEVSGGLQPMGSQRVGHK